MRLAFLQIGLLAFVVGSVSVGVGAQAPPRLEFDVVSIKPSRPGGSGAFDIGLQRSPDTVALVGITLRNLIARAYALKPYQIVGPASLDTERYDVTAKAGRAVSEAEQHVMLQSMLETRFSLIAHKETRELPCYELVVHRSGLKVRPAVPDDLGSRYFPGRNAIVAKAVAMSRLAELLSANLDRPVLDRTSVTAVFDIDLKWGTEADTAAPSIFTAVQEQLGLTLEAGKAPIETLIIDRIDRPREN